MNKDSFEILDHIKREYDGMNDKESSSARFLRRFFMDGLALSETERRRVFSIIESAIQ